jgi:hypothetical protein
MIPRRCGQQVMKVLTVMIFKGIAYEMTIGSAFRTFKKPLYITVYLTIGMMRLRFENRSKVQKKFRKLFGNPTENYRKRNVIFFGRPFCGWLYLVAYYYKGEDTHPRSLDEIFTHFYNMTK